jgi:hypothetical protein
MAHMLLLSGDFSTGYREIAKCRAEVLDPQFSYFSGQAAPGDTVVLHQSVDCGFGDSLQFSRYAPIIVAMGARVVLVVRPSLNRLFSASFPGIEVTSARWEAPLDHYQLPIHCLPYAFRATLETIPAPIPYLYNNATAWQGFLSGLPGLKVGLCWAGRGQPGWDARRSMRLLDMLPIFATGGCSFVSLQIGPPAAQLKDLPYGIVYDVSSRIRDWQDTANLVAGLDRVISVDTSICHLAGALGKPVWLLNRFDTCWRWLLDRTDSPWYPSMRIYRQPSPGDWKPVIEAVAADLRAAAGARNIGRALCL